jgi:transcriptional regulator with XRE-family HTH domain
MTRAQLAAASGVPANTIRRWEEGGKDGRNPTLPRLIKVLEALDCPEAESNAILEELGYPRRPPRFTTATHPNFYYSVEELQPVVEEAPWPEFVLNDNMELVAANVTAAALWGADFAAEKQRRTPGQMNLVALATSPEFIGHVVNWEEAVAAIASSLKWGASEAVMDQPPPYMNAVLEEMAAGDPAHLKALMDIFQRTPPREPKCRWTYPVRWRDEEAGDMRFTAIVNTASEPDGLAFNDWIPLDAETWTRLEVVKARARRGR